MELRRFDTEAGFELVAGAWRELAAAGASTPFQTLEWQSAWWRRVGRLQPRVSLELLLAAEGGRPAALAALALDRRNGELRFLGDPWADYADMLAAPGPAGAAGLEALLAEIRCGRESGRYGRVRLAEIPEESRMLRCGPVGFERVPASVCPYRELAGEECGGAPPGEYAVKRRRFEKIAPLHLLEHREGGAIVERLPAFFAMHLQEWADREGALSFDSDVMRGFYAGSVPDLAATGLVSLWELRLGGAAIAFYYGYRSPDTWFGYRLAYDVAWRRLSPGGVQHLMMFEALAAAGVRRFDFMRGDEPYKARFASGRRRNVTLVS